MARRAVVGTRSAGVGTRTGWQPRPIPGSHAAQGGAAVQLATDVFGVANDLVQHVTYTTDQAFRDHLLDRLYAQVRAQWPQPDNAPTATGYSLQLLGMRAQAQGDVLTWTMENLAPYAGFIRQRAHGNQRVMDRVFFDPGQTHAEALYRDLADRLVRV